MALMRLDIANQNVEHLCPRRIRNDAGVKRNRLARLGSRSDFARVCIHELRLIGGLYISPRSLKWVSSALSLSRPAIDSSSFALWKYIGVTNSGDGVGTKLS